jgi:hypothetical protein
LVSQPSDSIWRKDKCQHATGRLGKSPLEQTGKSIHRWIVSHHAEVFEDTAKVKVENYQPDYDLSIGFERRTGLGPEMKMN